MAKGVKTGGRESGTPNKITKEARELLKGVFENEIKQFEIILPTLEPKERLEITIKLLPYFLPKLEAVNLNINEAPKRDLPEWLK